MTTTEARNSTAGRRRLLGTALLCLATMALSGHGSAFGETSPTLRIQRLTWAGLKVENGTATLLVDPVESDIWNGARGDVIVPIEVKTASRYALITHTHNDHYDRPTLQRQLGERGRVICHVSVASQIASDGFRVLPVNTYEPISRGGFVITAVPAVDGIGDSQVSWIIRSGNRRIFHGGDTLWHGFWWVIGDQYGPFDAAFLPINGARMPTFAPASDQPMSMTPEQAVAAAVVLRATTLVPIHYGFSDPAEYVETPDAEAALAKAAQERKVEVRVLKRGDWLELP